MPLVCVVCGVLVAPYFFCGPPNDDRERQQVGQLAGLFFFRIIIEKEENRPAAAQGGWRRVQSRAKESRGEKKVTLLL